jgi:hypothetical protein
MSGKHCAARWKYPANAAKTPQKGSQRRLRCRKAGASMLRISTITALVALIGLLGCASLPDKLYRQIGDSEIGKINRIGLMQKYGPPQRMDKIDGHEFWTYVLDLGVQSNSFGTSYSSGSAAGFSPAPGTAQAFGYTSGFGSSSSVSQPVRDEFTYEIDKSGIVIA